MSDFAFDSSDLFAFKSSVLFARNDPGMSSDFIGRLSQVYVSEGAGGTVQTLEQMTIWPDIRLEYPATFPRVFTGSGLDYYPKIFGTGAGSITLPIGWHRIKWLFWGVCFFCDPFNEPDSEENEADPRFVSRIWDSWPELFFYHPQFRESVPDFTGKAGTTNRIPLNCVNPEGNPFVKSDAPLHFVRTIEFSELIQQIPGFPAGFGVLSVAKPSSGAYAGTFSANTLKFSYNRFGNRLLGYSNRWPVDSTKLNPVAPVKLHGENFSYYDGFDLSNPNAVATNSISWAHISAVADTEWRRVKYTDILMEPVAQPE